MVGVKLRSNGLSKEAGLIKMEDWKRKKEEERREAGEREREKEKGKNIFLIEEEREI